MYTMRVLELLLFISLLGAISSCPVGPCGCMCVLIYIRCTPTTLDVYIRCTPSSRLRLSSISPCLRVSSISPIIPHFGAISFSPVLPCGCMWLCVRAQGMYVCVLRCLYVCVFVCLYVCTHAYSGVYINVHERTITCVVGMYADEDVCLYVCMYVCTEYDTCVCVCVCKCS